jgi:uncharacterized cysteine cluster protein YcgN (CxxCxxCC family)
LSNKEWEDLCDGCGRCCLVKLEDEENGEVHYTNVACRYLDTESCRCSDYQNRATVNPRCMVLQRDKLEVLALMPYSCAYRLVHEGRDIGESPLELSVSGKVVSEQYIHDEQLPAHIVEWVRTGEES